MRYDLATGDVVYLDGGLVAGLDPGQVLEIVVPGELVRHPLDRRAVVGRYYDTRGRVRVLSVQEETAIGEILESCDAIRVGSELRLFEPKPVPLGRRTRMRPLNFPASMDELADAPAIVWSEDRVVSMGQGHLVYLDRGAAEDVLPGDVFTIYRRNEPGLPPVVLGELAVLSVAHGAGSWRAATRSTSGTFWTANKPPRRREGVCYTAPSSFDGTPWR